MTLNPLVLHCDYFPCIFIPAFNVTGLDRKEPVIYHGYTLTSKLPFREVIHTIKVRTDNTATNTVYM